jgi:transketolase
MTTLMFGGFFKSNLENTASINNDRLIFSKGHAAPLLYALYTAAGKVGVDELKTLRKFGSPLEGHPTMHFPYTEAATGSLGQGLSVGVGMALNAKKFDHVPYKTHVLLGDSEMAEGSVWEAMELAAYYQLNNLIGIIDVNRLGQRGETMHGWNTKAYENKVKAFGWNAVVVDGHDYGQIKKAFELAQVSDKPFMVIAKTIKGKGISFLENKEGWHGKALSKIELEQALGEMGKIDMNIVGKIAKPIAVKNPKSEFKNNDATSKIGEYKKDEFVSTRKAYGNAVGRIQIGS